MSDFCRLKFFRKLITMACLFSLGRNKLVIFIYGGYKLFGTPCRLIDSAKEEYFKETLDGLDSKSIGILIKRHC